MPERLLHALVMNPLFLVSEYKINSDSVLFIQKMKQLRKGPLNLDDVFV